MSKNVLVLKSLFDCICFCTKQGISFRGHRDDRSAEGDVNKGNFIELVQFCAKTDEILSTHLESGPKNAQYTSKTIQNQMISNH